MRYHILRRASGASSQPTMDEDWAARATASGVFYWNNFDFTTLQQLTDSNYGTPPGTPFAQLETVNKLSGSAACRSNILKTSSEGDQFNYRHSFVMPVGSQTKGTPKKTFYYQYAIYIPSYVLDHRFLTTGGQASSHKFCIIQEPDVSFGSGEVVTVNPAFRKAVAAYRITESGGSASHAWRTLPNMPDTPNTARNTYSTIDVGPQSDGAGGTDENDQDLFERRYGFLIGYQDGTTDYGAPLSQQGQPDVDQAVNGPVWVGDAWNVVEFYIDYTTQTLRMWHAVYGQAPTLVINAEGTADLGNRTDNYTGAQLLPRLEERLADATREDTYCIYGEVLASSNLINFPGGFVPPQSPTALSTAAAALSAGGSALFVSTWSGGDIPTGDDLNWINKFFYDHGRLREFSAAKLQGVHTAMTHHWLSEVDNIWVAENCNFNASGHVFDFIAYDYETGIGYLAPGGGKDNRLWSSTWSGGSLSAPVVATSSASPDLDAIMHGSSKQFTDGAAAIDVHPNLFGTGDAGVVVVCNRGVGAWRRSTNTWHIIIPFSVYGNIDTTPACVYSHALDAVVVSGATGTQCYVITNSTTYTQSGSGGLSAAPVPLGPDRGGENRGCVVDDPLRLGGWYVLEKVGSQRVWQYSGGAWVLKGYTHPFTANDSAAENWMVAPCYGLGIFKALERTGGQPQQRLWRPG